MASCLTGMLAIGPLTLVQLVLIQGCTRRSPPEKVTWEQLRASSQASLQLCTFVDVAGLPLQLLHPVTLRSTVAGAAAASGRATTGVVKFLSW